MRHEKRKIEKWEDLEALIALAWGILVSDFSAWRNKLLNDFDPSEWENEEDPTTILQCFYED